MIDRDMTVKASGGYIVQPLPDADEDDISRLEENIKRSEPVSSLVNRGLTPEEIAETVLKALNWRYLKVSRLNINVIVVEKNRKRIAKFG